MEIVKRVIDDSYIQYDPGDFVWSTRDNSSYGLDWQRIYRVKSFTPPAEGKKHGIVYLDNRLGPVSADKIRFADVDSFRVQDDHKNSPLSPEESEYFLAYLKWVEEDDRFGND